MAGEEKKDEEKYEVQPSPWSAVDAPTRVVGWRNGLGLTFNDTKEIMKKEKRAKSDYRAVRKENAKHKDRASKNPLQDLPPFWQAFYSTVPHLDPKAAYRAHQKEHKEEAETKNDKSSLKLRPGETQEEVEKDVSRLEAEVRKHKELVAEKKAQLKEWKKKCAKAQEADAEEEQQMKVVRANLKQASFLWGVARGKRKSSDTYFDFIYQDMMKTHNTKKANLTKSCSLLEIEIIEHKHNVRDMLKLATSQQQELPALGGSSQAAGSKDFEKASMHSSIEDLFKPKSSQHSDPGDSASAKDETTPVKEAQP